MRVVPMPSPNGTNHAGLFIDERLAFDSAEGLRGRDNAIDAETFDRLIEFLRDKLDSDSLAQVEQMFTVQNSDGGPAELVKRVASDAQLRARVALRGAPTDDFVRRFPNAARIRTV